MADGKPSLQTFYTDHWREIEPDRLAKYDKSFLRRSSFFRRAAGMAAARVGCVVVATSAPSSGTIIFSLRLY